MNLAIGKDPSSPSLESGKRELEQVQRLRRDAEIAKKILSFEESAAAVDSELMLMWWDPTLFWRWQVNLHYFLIPLSAWKGKETIMMTCRLDGPSVEVVKRMIDDAVETEEKGLEGNVYIDARGIAFDPVKHNDFGYAVYDESFRETATLLEKSGHMNVTLDNRETLLDPQAVPMRRFIPDGTRMRISSTPANS